MSEKMYHIGISKADIKGAKYAILPGDPKRVKKIAENFNNPVLIGDNREYVSYLGEISGENILAISTGIGGPSTAICVEELYKIGVENFIRVGTCGGMQENVLPGDLVIGNAAIRQDGTSKEYIPVEYPAVSDFSTTLALVNAAKEMEIKYHVGVVQCKDSFFGQHEPERMPMASNLLNLWAAYLKAGCLASEMESATLYAVASALGAKASTILLCIWNQEREKMGYKDVAVHNTTNVIKTAVKAIDLLIKG